MEKEVEIHKLISKLILEIDDSLWKYDDINKFRDEINGFEGLFKEEDLETSKELLVSCRDLLLSILRDLK